MVKTQTEKGDRAIVVDLEEEEEEEKEEQIEEEQQEEVEEEEEQKEKEGWVVKLAKAGKALYLISVAFVVLCVSMVSACWLIILVGLAVAKIVMGAINVHECSIESRIPVYLIVSAVPPFLPTWFLIRTFFKGIRNLYAGVCGTTAYAVCLAWNICGSVWVFPSYGKIMSDGFSLCAANVTIDCLHGTCNQELLRFALGMVIIDWLIFGILCAILVSCRCCDILMVFNRKQG